MQRNFAYSPLAPAIWPAHHRYVTSADNGLHVFAGATDRSQGVRYVRYLDRALQRSRTSMSLLSDEVRHELKGRTHVLVWLRRLGWFGAWLTISVAALRVTRVSAQEVQKVIINDHSNRMIQDFLSEVGYASELADIDGGLTRIKPTLIERIFASVQLLFRPSTASVVRSHTQRDTALVWSAACTFPAQVAVFEQVLLRRRFRPLLTVDDLSRERIALGAAAELTGTEVGVFMMNGRDRPTIPFPVKVVFGQDEKQLERNQPVAGVRAARQPRLTVFRTAALRTAEPIAVGVIVNYWSDESLVNDLVTELNSTLNCRDIIVRFHPRCKPDLGRLNQSVRVHDSGLSIDHLARSCDLVFGGRTTVVEELLRLGVPVVTTSGLDRLEGEPYGLSEMGGIFTVERPVESVNLPAIADFYDAVSSRMISAGKQESPSRSPEWRQGFRSLMRTSARCTSHALSDRPLQDLDGP